LGQEASRPGGGDKIPAGKTEAKDPREVKGLKERETGRKGGIVSRLIKKEIRKGGIDCIVGKKKRRAVQASPRKMTK